MTSITSETRRRILVVEDNYLTAEVLCDLVRGSGHFVAGAVGTIDKALALAENEPLDGAVLDINLHGTKSFPVCEALHSRKIPFMFVTAYPESAVGEHAWQPQSLLTKPVDATKFRTALDLLIARPDRDGNALLDTLPAAENAVLREHLEPAVLRPGATLENPGRRPEYMYFPSNGLISVQTGARDRRLEVSLIGNEGVTGLTALLGDRGALYESEVQVGGTGQRIATAVLADLIARRPALSAHFDEHLHRVIEELGQSALINGHGSIEERLVRRLLMAS
ncbi:MAG TPA: response regulator, partial [Reyranellaceae bacterium]|nr:response regulator [Reyranellaceae bacterium]